VQDAGISRYSLLFSSALILFLSVGLSVITGEVMLGLLTGVMNVAGLAVFSLFMAASLRLLVAVLASIRTFSPTGNYSE
jgi:hypothetical protein